jgi:adenosylcobinamide amidohydrolase
VTASAPLKPGAEADFRLIFEDVPENWNQQVPEIRLTQVSTQ